MTSIPPTAIQGEKIGAELHNILAEQALLGALLVDNSTLEQVVEFLQPAHFSVPAHGKIYKIICSYVERGQVADPIILKSVVDQIPELEEQGGAKYLVELLRINFVLSAAGDYGQTITNLHIRRCLMRIGDGIRYEAHQNHDTTPMQQIERAEKSLYDLATSGTIGGVGVDFETAMTQAISLVELAFKRTSHVVGVTTGLMDIDKTLGGLHPSDLIILAGRPSMGKTALATNIAFNAAHRFMKDSQDGAPVAFFSLEMSAEQLASRIISAEARIGSDQMRRGAITKEDFQRIFETGREISQIKLFIDDTPALTMMGLRNRARRLKRTHNIGLIIIDYLQLLETGSKRSSDGRVQEISEISRGLKAIAKELNVPVLALSQLSRAVEQREDKRPQLSDLRESGSIEQDADVVMFVYRDEYYEGRREPPAGTDKHIEWLKKMNVIQNQAEVIIAKQRHGPVGSVKLFFDGRLTKFANAVHVAKIG